MVSDAKKIGVVSRGQKIGISCSTHWPDTRWVGLGLRGISADSLTLQVAGQCGVGKGWGGA